MILFFCHETNSPFFSSFYFFQRSLQLRSSHNFSLLQKISLFTSFFYHSRIFSSSSVNRTNFWKEEANFSVVASERVKHSHTHIFIMKNTLLLLFLLAILMLYFFAISVACFILKKYHLQKENIFFSFIITKITF